MDPGLEEETLDNRDMSFHDEAQESLNSSGYPVLHSWSEDQQPGQGEERGNQPRVTKSGHFIELEEEKEESEHSESHGQGGEEGMEEDEDDREDRELLSELR